MRALGWLGIARLGLVQVALGSIVVLVASTLNRVMIVELGVSAALVSVMVSLPLVLAPFRALIGFRSDRHRSALGWRRVPYIWIGTLLQFGGLSIMPFALIILSGDSNGPAWVGPAAAALAFLMVGAGMHTVQTAGLALATPMALREVAGALLRCARWHGCAKVVLGRTEPGEMAGRLALARAVLVHRVLPRDPLAAAGEGDLLGALGMG